MSLANQIRILRANLQAITTEIGVGFAAAIRHVVILLNKLLEKVLIVSKAFSTFMQTLFGKYKGGSKGFTFDDYGMDDAEDNLGNMSDSASGVADGLSDADDATKKLKKDLSVLPFDELNQLSKDLESSTKTDKDKSPSSGTYEPNIGGLDDMMDGLFDLDFDGLESPLGKLEEYVSAWAERIKEQFNKKNWDGLGREVAKGINDFVDYLLGIFDPDAAKSKLGEWIDAFTTSFNGFVDELHFDDIGRLIGEGLDVVVSSVNRLVDGIDWQHLGEQLANGANGLVETVPWEDLGKLLTNKFNILWNMAEGFATTFDWAGLGTALARGANAFVDKIDFESLVNAVSAGLNGIANAVKKFATNFKWAELGQKLAKNANKLISQIDIASIGAALGNMLNGLFTTAYNFVSNFDWKSLGSMFARGINSLVNTVDFDLIAKTVYTELNRIIDTVRQFIADLDVVTAGNKLGAAFSKMINGINWQDLGNGLAEIWNKAWSFLKEFISNLGTYDVRVEGLYSFNNISQSDVDKALKKGTGIGQALHDALKGIIESVKIDDMTDSINKLVQKIAEDISVAFGDETLWYNIGHTIGDALGSIVGNDDTMSKAGQAVAAISKGLKNLFIGAIDGLGAHITEIRTSLISFVSELPWDAILGTVAAILTAKIAAKIPLIIAGIAIKKALTSSIKGTLTEVAEDEAVSSAGGGVFKGVISGAEKLKEKLATVLPKAVETLKSSITGLGAKLEGLGTKFIGFGEAIGGAAEGSFISLVVAAAAELQKFQEQLRGGNGILTEAGGAFDSFVEKLREMGIITKDTDDKLFALKESMELGDIDNPTFLQEFSKTLEEAGVNGEQARTVVDNLAGSLNLTETQVNALNDAIEGIGESTSNSTDILEKFGTNSKDAAEQVRIAINDAWWKVEEYAQDTGDTITEYSVNIQDQFMKMIASGGDFGQSLLNILPYFSEVEGGTEALRQAIDDKLGAGAFDALITGVNSAGDAFDTTSGKVENYGNHVKTAGELVATATEHSKAYNDTTGKSPSLIETLLPIIGGLATKFLASFGQKDQYYSTMETNVGETGKAVEDKGSVLTNAVQSLASKALATFRTNLPKYKSSAEEIPSGISTGIQTKEQEPVNMVQQMSEMMQEKFALHNGIRSPSTVYSEMAENIPLGVIDGIKNKAPDVLNALESFVTSMTTKAETLVNNFKSALEKGGSEAVEKLVNGMQSKEDVLSQQIEKIKGIFDKFAESVSEIANSAYGQGEMITGKLAEGMDSQKDNIDRVIVEIASSLAEFTNFITTVKETIENDSRGISDGLITGLGEGESEISMLLENYKGAFEELLEYLTNSAYDFENAGASIINALQSGLNSIYLQLPTIDVNWTPYTYGDGGYFELPSFSVNWYAKGGIFTDPSIIGVGEVDNEAVLPLTNRRTMGMIADAIVSNSSGIGLDEQSLIDAIAQGYVRAMMSNQNNQQQQIINVVCKTENDEVLFRAVERGRSSVQYRNNPTAQY